MLSDSTEENKGQMYAYLMLQKSVLSDINDENVYQEIVALAIIEKIITTPFMKLVDSKTFATHILGKHFHQLQIDLKHWSSTIVFSWNHLIKCWKGESKLSAKFSLRTEIESWTFGLAVRRANHYTTALLHICESQSIMYCAQLRIALKNGRSKLGILWGKPHFFGIKIGTM